MEANQPNQPNQPTKKKTYKVKRTEAAEVPERIKKAVKKTVVLPKQPETVEEWAKARAKYPNLFTFTKDGDLVSAPVQPTDTEKIIIAPRIVYTKPEQLKEFFQTRIESLKEPEETFAAAKRNLQQMMMVYKANPGAVSEYDIVLANQQVHDAECILNSLAKGSRSFITERGITGGQLTHNWYDRSVIPNEVCIAQYTTFPPEAFYTEAADEPAAAPSPLPTAAEVANIITEAVTSLTAAPPKPPMSDARRAAIIAARIKAKSSRGA
jgi:hypothetical protein